MPMSKNLVYIGVAVLFVIAVFLGYKIYQQQYSQQSSTKSTSSQNINTKTKASPSQSPTAQQKVSASDLEILKFPADLSSQEGVKWMQEVKTKAKTADSLDVSNCQASPIVLNIQNGAELKITNKGNSEVSISGIGNISQLTRGGVLNTKITAEGDPAYLGYRCSLTGSPQNIIGILYVTK